MLQRTLIISFLILGFNFSMAQSSIEAQNKILSQFEYLIPKSSSFASWTMFEGDFDGDKKKDYIFSYILSNKQQRHLHAGSGVLIISRDAKKKLKLLGHITSKSKNIYAFSSYSNKIFYLKEYDAATNYQTIKKELKYIQKDGKFVRL